MEFKKSVASLAVAAALGGLASTAQAVYLSEDGTGQVLLFPYYTARGDNDTLVSVVNTTSRGKAVKVRVLEGKNSREVIDFNLYLSPFDAWSAVVTRNADGNPILRTFDKSCTSPVIPASATVAGSTEVAFRNFTYSGSQADRGGSTLGRGLEGYIELIEMGEIQTNYVLVGTSTASTNNFLAAITHVAGVPLNCPQVTTSWNNGNLAANQGGLDVPRGGLFGSAAVINVPQGTDYSFEPVTLDSFFAVPTHTNPGDLQPSLAGAFPLSTVIIKDPSGVFQIPVISGWTFGVDAVSSVLMHRSLFNEFVTNPALGAGTDFIVSFPTKRFYVPVRSLAPSNASFGAARPFTRSFIDNDSVDFLPDGTSPGACETMVPTIYGREEEAATTTVDFSPLPPGGSFSLCWEVNVITVKNTNVLGSIAYGSPTWGLRYNVNPPGAVTDGWFQLTFPNNYSASITNRRWLASNNGNTFFGLPVVGFAVQRYVNGNVGGVLSNYGGAYVHKYQRDIIVAPSPQPL